MKKQISWRFVNDILPYPKSYGILKKMENTKRTIQKQTKILKILKSFSKKRLEEISGKDFTFKNMSREEMKNWMDCVWIDLGKESATDKEMVTGLNNVFTIAIMETLRRRGLLFINKKGNFDKTKLGKDVVKYIDKQEGKFFSSQH